MADGTTDPTDLATGSSADSTAEFAIAPLLTAHLAGHPLDEAQRQRLLAWELADPRRAAAWGIDADNGTAKIDDRLTWLTVLSKQHGALPLPTAPLTHYLALYWQLWLPLALSLKQACDQLNTPLVQGILGVQGTGKTTLTLVLQHMLQCMGYNTVGLSIDDLYKTYADRQQLIAVDPRLRWRGPPGTHDIALGLATLATVRAAAPGEALPLPQFDKSLHGGEGDRTEPRWVKDVDIVLFEGWFLGTRPIAPAQFDHPPPPIDTEADRQFARDMNTALADYLPLWDCLDRLMVLCPEDYHLSKQWRKDAEHQMKAEGKPGMSDTTIEAFVDYFWRALHPDLFITPLKQEGEHVNLVVEIGRDRRPKAIYTPALVFPASGH
jgi:D-glycerate 3-kinase